MKKNEPHVCPASNISYVGRCPVTTCPANLVALGATKAGCFFLKGKPDIDVFSRVLRVSSKEIKLRYAVGLRNLDKMIKLNNMLAAQRQLDYSDNSSFICENCGIRKPSVGNCLNLVRCTEREKLASRALQRYPLNIAQFAFSKFDFWRIVTLEKNPEFPKVLSKVIYAQAIELGNRIK